MIRLTNQTNIPLPIFEEMGKMYGSHPKMSKDHFSATEMNKSVKDIVLNRTHDDVVDIDIQYRMKPIRGTWFHEAMENRLKGRSDCLCEQRFSMNFPVKTEVGTKMVTLSGGIDCVWKKSEDEYIILDYKNSNQTKIDKESVDEDSDWKRQMYIYAMLFELEFGVRPTKAIMVCFDDSKRAGEIDLNDLKSLVCQWFEIDLLDRDYEARLVEDIGNRLSSIVNCLEYGYSADDCTEEECWMTNPKFGVKKKDAEDYWRVKSSMDDAKALIASIKGKKEDYHIYEEPRCPKKCLKHCDHKEYCEQGKALVAKFLESNVNEYDWMGNPVEKSKEN